MKLIEEKNDLFNYTGKYWLAHCISSDFALGAGIAVSFDKQFGLKKFLLSNYFKNSWYNKGYCIKTSYCKVFNLVTKKKYSDKPTYKTLQQSLIHMRNMMRAEKIYKVAMPVIGCGLDKLDWIKVKSIIEKVFENDHVTIIVCKL